MASSGGHDPNRKRRTDEKLATAIALVTALLPAGTLAAQQPPAQDTGRTSLDLLITDFEQRNDSTFVIGTMKNLGTTAVHHVELIVRWRDEDEIVEASTVLAVGEAPLPPGAEVTFEVNTAHPATIYCEINIQSYQATEGMSP